VEWVFAVIALVGMFVQDWRARRGAVALPQPRRPSDRAGARRILGQRASAAGSYRRSEEAVVADRYPLLLTQVGDRRRAALLIDYQKRKAPGTTRSQCIENAISAWDRNNRSWR
jgi:hypothetical protein